MPEIHLLASEISDLIAAGEVVERPSSVVKELVENSIDAGAKQISVEIVGGGLRKIKVSDDGVGMSSTNAEKCFLKHATSKILNKEDLFSIKTLGFRGEALPSIAAVSRVRLITKERESLLGYEVLNVGGVIEHKGEVGAADGTTFEVTDLFYNTPARLKFMKSEQAESGVINSLMEKLALSHPDISFKFITNGSIKLFTPGNGKVSDAVYAIYGRDFASRLLQVNYEADNVKIKGYIGKPLLNKPNRNFQIFFVNGRLIKSRVLQQALEQSYRNAMLVGRYPCCVVFITLPFAEIDINVHPSKTEIKFADDTYISNHLNRAISISLREDIGIFQVEEPKKTEEKKPVPVTPVIKQTEEKTTPIEVVKPAERPVLKQEPQVKPEVKTESSEKTVAKVEPKEELVAKVEPKEEPRYKEETDLFGSWQIFQREDNAWGQVADDEPSSLSFITFENNDVPLENIQKIVQPEKEVLAETPKEEPLPEPEISVVSKEEAPAQELLLGQNGNTAEDKEPETAVQTEIAPVQEESFRIVGEVFKTYILIEKEKELQLIDKHALHERMIFEQLKTESGVSSQILLTPYICNLGVSENNVIDSNKEALAELGFDIEALGSSLIIREIPDIVNMEDVEYILSKTADFIKLNGKITEEVFDELLYIVACKAAIKSGHNTSLAEIEVLIREYFKNIDNLRYCPHGRPIVISFTQAFIEKQFKRIV